MPLIQKPTPGLAKFLGVETQGRLPLNAVTDVVPVVEIEDYLGPNNWGYLEDAAVVPNGFIEIEVPEKKFWRLKWAAVTIETGAGTYSNANLAIFKNEIQRTVRISPYMNGEQVFVAATNGQYYAFRPQQRSGFGLRLDKLNAEPGDKIQVLLTNTSGVANSFVSLWLQFQQLDL